MEFDLENKDAFLEFFKDISESFFFGLKVVADGEDAFVLLIELVGAGVEERIVVGGRDG
jgi:hypothetical protein